MARVELGNVPQEDKEKMELAAGYMDTTGRPVAHWARAALVERAEADIAKRAAEAVSEVSP